MSKDIEHKIKLKELDKKLDKILSSLDILAKDMRSSFDAEHYFTDTELAKHIKVSKRTLANWRQIGFIPYYLIGGKVLYKATDIQKVLDKYYFNIQ